MGRVPKTTTKKITVEGGYLLWEGVLKRAQSTYIHITKKNKTIKYLTNRRDEEKGEEEQEEMKRRH